MTRCVCRCVALQDTTAEDVANVVIVAIYSNLKKLLGDHLDEAQYLKIVRNEILVDIQNDDILYQIFTCTVLHRKAGEEAPFLEFIQRQCSQKCNPDGSKRCVWLTWFEVPTRCLQSTF